MDTARPRDRFPAPHRIAAAAAAGFALLGFLAISEAAYPARQPEAFLIRIPPTVRVRVLHQVRTFVVSTVDIERGFIEVRAASRLHVTSNIAWAMDFRPQGNLFRAARVTGLPQDLHLGPEGGTLANLLPAKRPARFELSYRFDLHPEAMPGSHPWPLAISVSGA